jgi:glycosyltransferase involved in cell wall biosynthesis
MVAGPAPVVSVLMSVRDGPVAMLEQAVESILGQTFRDFEFLIYDDGSGDRKVLDALQRYAQREPRIRLRHEPPRGLTKTLNIGLAEARGRYIARQDADDWSEPERLARQVAFLDSRVDVVVCGSNARMRQEDGAPLWVTRLPLEPAAIDGALWDGNPFLHGAAMFHTEAARVIGGYSEAFVCSQDYEFFWRLCDYGGGANLAAPLYHYRFRRGAVSAERAADQARAHKAAQALAWARRIGGSADAGEALAQAGCREQGPEERLGSQLKQADHRMLAGDYAGAVRAYSSLLLHHPASVKAWGKWVRWFVFLMVPAARRLCFR